MGKMRKRIGLLMLAVLLSAFICPAGAAWAADQGQQRVFDQAELLAPEEEAQLETEIAGLRDQMKMDVVLVTTLDSKGKSARDYADDFYDQGGFGTRKDFSGVLYLIDMDNRELYISTCGTMIRFLTDERIESMLDHAYDSIVKGNYFGTAESFLTDTAYWYEKGIPGGQYNYDTETGKISRYRSITLLEALIALGVAAGLASAVCLNIKKEYAMEADRSRVSNYLLAYRASAQFVMRDQQDRLLNSFTSQTVIPRQPVSRGGSVSRGSGGSRSSTHTSSGGRSHGGGGRRF